MPNMVDEILAQIPADDLAAQLGTDPDTAMDAARKALPALLSGLSNEASTGGGDALGTAVLQDHNGSLLDQANPLATVDTADGQKILGHVFGDRQDQVVQTLGASSKADSSIFSKLLPMLAPLVMAWLSKRMGGALGGATQTDATEGGGGGLGGLLGGLLGGGSDSSGGGLGDLLGGLLGGEVEKGKSEMPDLGGLFDMFGDGSKAGGVDKSDVTDVGDVFGR